jgi:hypothetical protein
MVPRTTWGDRSSVLLTLAAAVIVGLVFARSGVAHTPGVIVAACAVAPIAAWPLG